MQGNITMNVINLPKCRFIVTWLFEQNPIDEKNNNNNNNNKATMGSRVAGDSR